MANIKSAYLIPSSPLPVLQPDAKGMQPLVEGLDRAKKSLAAASPGVIVAYSSAWVAVVDQLWLTRSEMTGRFVDPTWHELGHIDWRITVDVPVTEKAVPATSEFGVTSRGVDYDAFPIDSGTIVFSQSVNTNDVPLVLTSNNLYHDWGTTQNIARTAVDAALSAGHDVSVVGMGGLSGSIFREGIDFDEDRIHSPEEDQANQKLLDLLVSSDTQAIESYVPEYNEAARADMGMKHLGFILGALGGSYSSAEVLGYGPLGGSGGAVVEFTP